LAHHHARRAEVGGDATELWVPLGAASVVMGELAANAAAGASAGVRERVDAHGISWLWLVGRLAPGATVARARAEMTALTARVRAEDPMFGEQRIDVAPGVGLRP